MSLLNFVCSLLVETSFSDISSPIPPTIIIWLKKVHYVWSILAIYIWHGHCGLWPLSDNRHKTSSKAGGSYAQDSYRFNDFGLNSCFGKISYFGLIYWLLTDSLLTLPSDSSNSLLSLYWLSTDTELTHHWLSNEIYLFSTDFYWHLLTLYWLSVESLDWLSKIVWDQHQHHYHHKESEKVS